MSRFINPIPQYKPNSKLYFFKSGTNSQLVTYKDQFENTANTHPVLTDSAGFVPNIFFSGSAKLIVADENDVQYINRDPVGGNKELGDFTLWDAVVIYDKNDIVEGSDGKFYQSLSNGNEGNDPTTSPSSWVEIRFIGVWNASVTYSVGDVVQTLNGNLWKSLTSAINNDPSTDDGTNWLPAVDLGGQEAIAVTGNFTAEPENLYLVTSGDITMPAVTVGEIYEFHAVADTVRLLNPSYTINGSAGSISAGDDMIINEGQTVRLSVEATNTLRIS